MTNDLRPVEKEDLIFDVDRALDKAAYLWPRKRGPGDHNPYGMVARAVVEHWNSAGCGFSEARRGGGRAARRRSTAWVKTGPPEGVSSGGAF